MERVLVFAVLATLIVGGECRGEFDLPSNLANSGSKQPFQTERLKSFRGGFDRGDDLPGRFRQPNPRYDNTVYSAPNFFQHELVYLEGDLVLDFQPSTGEYRIFKLVRHPDDMCPIVPERPITSGVWANRKFHKLVYIGCSGALPGGKMLDINPAKGTYDVVRFNHRAGRDEDPMMEVLASGYHREAINFQPLFVNEDELIFYDRQTGGFSTYYLDPQLPTRSDPIQPSEPILFGKLQGLHEQLIYIGHNTIMDYDPLFGRYWLYEYDRTATNMTNPFLGPLASGTIEKGMVPMYLAEDQMVLLDPETGMFAGFDLKRPTLIDGYSESKKTEEEKEDERVAKLELHGPGFNFKADNGNFGFGSIVRANQCADKNTCRGCLKMPGCGWCATNSLCMRGSTNQPCAGNCTTWQPVFCDGEPCSSHADCSTCLSDPFCGWCDETAQCTEGVSSGPLFGACAGWSKVNCPNLSLTGEVIIDAPCVDGGLISL